MAYEDEVEALENAILERFAGWLDGIDNLKRVVATDGDVAAAIAKLELPSQSDFEDALREAYGIGHDETMGMLTNVLTEEETLQADLEREMPSDLLRDLADEMRGLFGDASDAKDKADKLARTGASADETAAPLFGNAAHTRRVVATNTNRAANEAALRVGRAVDRPLVWVAERNACVRCLAHSGHVIQRAGQSFPKGLTFGKYQYDDAVKCPPLHPHCRCHLEVLVHQSYADALKREAQRSVLKGWSLESESMSTRLDAAQRLLDSNPDMPASVLKDARDAIKRGAFPAREVPSGSGGSTGSSKPKPKPKPSGDGGASFAKDELLRVDVSESEAAERIAKGLDGKYGKLTLKVEPDDIVVEGDGFVSMASTIRNPQGDYAGDLRRNFYTDDDGNLIVSNELMRLSPEYQGQGFSTEFTKRAESYYRASGVKEVEVHAGLDAGGYVWAKAGYDWDTKYGADPYPDNGQTLSRETTAIRLRFEIYADDLDDGPDKDAIYDATSRMRQYEPGDPEYPTPFELSTLPNALELLKGTEWHGRKLL